MTQGVVSHEPVIMPRRLASLDAELRRFSRLRGRWDELLGHLALLLRQLGLWRDMQRLDREGRRLPCMTLAREAEASEEAQTCGRVELASRVPARVGSR